MKNFIQNHPYLSCAGLAIATNASCAVISRVFCNKNTKNILEKFSTIPSIVATVVDRVGHRSLFDNKPLTALTAVESALVQVAMVGPKEYFTDLIKLDLTKDSVICKTLLISSLVQSVGFKYILDSAAEAAEAANELAPAEESQTINSEVN